MVSEKLINKHNIINIWVSSQRANNNFGFKRGFIGECENGQWLVVIQDDLWKETSIIVNSRYKATKHLRANGFWTRLRKVRQC